MIEFNAVLPLRVPFSVQIDGQENGDRVVRVSVTIPANSCPDGFLAPEKEIAETVCRALSGCGLYRKRED